MLYHPRKKECTAAVSKIQVEIPNLQLALWVRAALSHKQAQHVVVVESGLVELRLGRSVGNHSEESPVIEASTSRRHINTQLQCGQIR